ncbi:MBL fold metallo-hydrolase [Rhodobacter sphaeroides]|uniref:MBL fold metallo-hydrolase n=1 Tax=Cereibacter sphaeroides TaxID=1063 RepID=UPI00132082D2|nr:MBL fold metallo-hydrolase [Cereibacter sphaeroides]MWP40132.1 MBL fold metallo-hydrolase [Cereibacter sphaeroides]
MIPRTLHAVLDGVSAGALMFAPRLLGWPRHLTEPMFLAGAGVAAYSLVTRYRDDAAGLIGMNEHRALDAAQGAAFCVAATRADASPGVRRTLAAYGLFSLAAAALTQGEHPVRRMGRQVRLPADALVAAGQMGVAAEVAPGLAYLRLGIVNAVFIGPRGAGDRGWILVDAGLPGTAHVIEAAAARRFGAAARPRAIVMTHGHFDHVGALETLANRWDVPVYAHPEERPYLDGSRSYPPAAPEAGGGLMARLAPLYPRRPVNVGPRLHDLSSDGSIPGVESWCWLHTPGHAPGHISLWRESDGALISGDAVITTRQEGAYAVALQKPEMHGPPAYFTPDWAAARASVRRLATLNPKLVVAGHGRPAAGPKVAPALALLAEDFDEVAVPCGSRYAPTA